MEEKNKLVLEYINSIKEAFEKNGNPISDEAVSRITNQYINSSKTFIFSFIPNTIIVTITIGIIVFDK